MFLNKCSLSFSLFIFIFISTSSITSLAASNEYSCPKYIDSVKKDNNFTCLDKYPNNCFSILYRIDCDYYEDGSLKRETHELYEGYGEDIKSFKDGLLSEYNENGSIFKEEIYDRDKLRYRKIYNDISGGIIYQEEKFNEGSFSPIIKREFVSAVYHKYEKRCPKKVSEMMQEVKDGKAEVFKENLSTTEFIKDGYLCEYLTGLNSFKNMNDEFKDSMGSLITQSEIDKNGILNGERRKFDKNTLNSITIYKDGKKSGEGKEFDEKGNVILTVNFVNDKASLVKKLNKDGSLFGEVKLNTEEKPIELNMYREKNNHMLKIHYLDDYPDKGICYKKQGGIRQLNEAELIYFTSKNKEFRDCDE